MSNGYTPTTKEVREEYSITVIDGTVLPSRARAFDQWFAGEIVAAMQRGYEAALRNAAEACANYSGHPYNAAATLAMGFSMAVGILEKED